MNCADFAFSSGDFSEFGDFVEPGDSGESFTMTSFHLSFDDSYSGAKLCKAFLREVVKKPGYFTVRPPPRPDRSICENFRTFSH